METINGCTPMHNTCKEGRRRTAKFLLDKGANADLKSKARLTPIDLASKHNHVQLTK